VELDMLQRGLITQSIDIYQLGYRTDVQASANTHAAGGCTDVGQYHTNQITVWREWGWTMQRRDLKNVKTHAHGWPYRCGHLAPAAIKQENDWDRKDAGLVGSAKVVGMWPIKPWYIAMEEKMASVLDAAKQQIAIQVLNQDDEISNAGQLFTDNPANPYVSLHTAQEQLMKAVREIQADIRLIKAAQKL